jgi:hypothetical protein
MNLRTVPYYSLLVRLGCEFVANFFVKCEFFYCFRHKREWFCHVSREDGVEKPGGFVFPDCEQAVQPHFFHTGKCIFSSTPPPPPKKKNTCLSSRPLLRIRIGTVLFQIPDPK